MWAPTSEERWLSEMAWLRDRTTLNEEDIVIAEQRLSEERRWQEEAMAARDARGERMVWMDVVMGPDVSEEGTPGTPWDETDSDECSISAGVLEDAGEMETTDEWSLSTDVLEAAGELEPSEEGSWSDWSVTSSELAQAALDQAEEDAEIEARMAQEDRELSEELMITLAKADDKFNSLVTAAIYNWYLHLRCNKVVHEKYKLEQRMSNTMAGGAMPASGREDSVMVAGIDDTEIRNKEAVEAPTYGGAKKVKRVLINLPDGNYQSLPVTGHIATASAILDADKAGAMDAKPVPVPRKLVPRHRREKIISGTEGANFDQEVADACKEGVEHLREGGKIYLAIKSAMGDGCVGTYQFVTDEVAHYITAFVLSSVVEILYPTLGEIRALRGERAITAVEAAGDAALIVLAAKQEAKKAATGSWAEESSKVLAVVWSGGAGTPETFQAVGGATGSAPESAAEDSSGIFNDTESSVLLTSTLETPLGLDSSQISNRGRGLDRGAARGRSRGEPRGRGRARGKLSSRSQGAGSAAASGAGYLAVGPKNAEIIMLPTVDTPLRLEGPGNRRSAMREGGGGSATQGFVESSKRAETRILSPILDKSLMADNSQLGKGNRKIAPNPTGHQQTTGGGDGGYAQPPILPAFDEPFPFDNSQHGTINRRIAPNPTSHEQQFEGFARDYAGTRMPPRLDKSLMADNSQLGKLNRTTTGSYQQPIVSFARDYAGTPMPPRLDKSLMTDNSQLGKRKRESESAPVVTGSHQQATEGTAGGYGEGSPNAQRLIPSTLPKHVELDASNLSAGRRGRGRRTKRAREN
ncbi:hypothetical protein V498_09265 [Pseudogymnoascus sp. VKM F-4517 (FW-2822)]|nr:hypothetical protein V498_09265 [Pseudogymnoascus sp. VKM F-4517 (FW-2822)]